MTHSPFEDKRAEKLFARVRDDLSSLRSDVSKLLRHTTQRTLPDGARELARSGREQLISGRDYAAARIRRVGQSAREHPAGVSAAGVVLLGAVALGVYLLLREGCCSQRAARDEELELGDEI